MAQSEPTGVPEHRVLKEAVESAQPEPISAIELSEPIKVDMPEPVKVVEPKPIPVREPVIVLPLVEKKVVKPVSKPKAKKSPKKEASKPLPSVDSAEWQKLDQKEKEKIVLQSMDDGEEQLVSFLGFMSGCV